MPEQHTLFGGKVYVYKRPNSSLWQCSTYLAGKNRRFSTKEESLSKAKEIAEDWHVKLRGKLRSGDREFTWCFLREPGHLRDHRVRHPRRLLRHNAISFSSAEAY